MKPIIDPQRIDALRGAWARAESRLARFDPRLLALALAGLLALVAVQAWLLALRQPLAQQVRVKSDAVALQQAVALARELPQQAAALEQEIATLQQAAGAALPPDAAEPIVVRLVADIDRLAQRHDVALTSVRPAGTNRVAKFDEVRIDVEARGGYGALVDWLVALERGIGNLAIVAAELRPGARADALALNVKLAAYWTPAAPGAAGAAQANAGVRR
ncbi:MAG TPA: GspMb/PilO family protein [Burkholderiaceae bacterium]|nr:GspMb/PilO family protein [Burkholderiaceae bacterium]